MSPNQRPLIEDKPFAVSYDNGVEFIFPPNDILFQEMMSGKFLRIYLPHRHPGVAFPLDGLVRAPHPDQITSDQASEPFAMSSLCLDPSGLAAGAETADRHRGRTDARGRLHSRLGRGGEADRAWNPVLDRAQSGQCQVRVEMRHS